MKGCFRFPFFGGSLLASQDQFPGWAALAHLHSAAYEYVEQWTIGIMPPLSRARCLTPYIHTMRC